MTNLQPKNAVVSGKLAIDILTKNGAVFTITKTGRCECGETSSEVGYDVNNNMIGYVVICNSCGNDNSFEDDIFNH